MKRIFHLFIASVFAVFLLGGCDGLFKPDKPAEEIPVDTEVMAPLAAVKYNSDQDTLTNAETETFTILTANVPVEYEIGISADSISGTTTATCYLYQYMDFGSSDKYRIETITVNHAPYRYRETGTIVGGALTCECTSTGTQVTHVRVDMNLVPRSPQ